jgi:hypothetical protein
LTTARRRGTTTLCEWVDMSARAETGSPVSPAVVVVVDSRRSQRGM